MRKSPTDIIVVETEVWLDALLSGGAGEELVRMALGRGVTLVTSEVLLENLMQELRSRLGFSDSALLEARRFVMECCEVVVDEAGLLQTAGDVAKARGATAIARLSTGRTTSLSLCGP